MQLGAVILVCYNSPCETHERGTIYTSTITTPIRGVGKLEGKQKSLPTIPTGPPVPPCQSAFCRLSALLSDTVLSHGTL